MASQPPQQDRPGTFRIVLAALVVFILISLPLIAKYVWQGIVDNSLMTLIAAIVGGILSNLDRIFSSFFPKKGE